MAAAGELSENVLMSNAVSPLPNEFQAKLKRVGSSTRAIREERLALVQERVSLVSLAKAKRREYRAAIHNAGAGWGGVSSWLGGEER